MATMKHEEGTVWFVANKTWERSIECKTLIPYKWNFLMATGSYEAYKHSMDGQNGDR